MYASNANGRIDLVDMDVQPINDASSCASYSFSVLPEPAPAIIIIGPLIFKAAFF